MQVAGRTALSPVLLVDHVLGSVSHDVAVPPVKRLAFQLVLEQSFCLPLPSAHEATAQAAPAGRQLAARAYR